MPITINGSGTFTGISVGGLPDGIVDTDMVADDAITEPKTSLITNRPAFSAYTSASYDIAASTAVKGLFQTEFFDTDNAYDTSTSTFTVPSGMGGAYQVNAQVSVDDINDGTYMYCAIYLDGSEMSQVRSSYNYSPASDKIITAAYSNVLELTAGQTVNVYVYHNSTGTQASENPLNWFSMFRLGGVTT